MDKSLEELRSILNRMRRDLGAPASPARPPARPEPADPLPFPRLGAAPSAPAPPARPAEGPEPRWLRPLFFSCVPLALAGMLLGSRLLLAAGFLGACVALYLLTQRGRPGQEDLGDMDAKIAALERRIAALRAASGPGLGRELEEEVRELRTLVQSLFKTLEAPPAPEHTRGGDENEPV